MVEELIGLQLEMLLMDNMSLTLLLSLPSGVTIQAQTDIDGDLALHYYALSVGDTGYVATAPVYIVCCPYTYCTKYLNGRWRSILRESSCKFIANNPLS